MFGYKIGYLIVQRELLVIVCFHYSQQGPRRFGGRSQVVDGVFINSLFLIVVEIAERFVIDNHAIFGDEHLATGKRLLFQTVFHDRGDHVQTFGDLPPLLPARDNRDVSFR